MTTRLAGLAAVPRIAVRGALALAVLAVASTCDAHPVGVSRGEYRALGGGVEARLTFSRAELAVLGDETRAVERIHVRAERPCTAELVRRTELERDGVALVARFDCHEAGPFHVSLAPLLAALARGHRHEARLSPGGTTVLVFESEPDFVLAAARRSDSEPRDGSARPFAGFLRLGIEHILSGYDHLVFLLGLVVVGLGTRRTVVVASAFTLAHSLSLAAAVLGIWTPPSVWVEPLIALSIVVVGLENLVGGGHERRAWLAFGFGLVHGFGFAGALAGARFTGVELVRALVGFNGGVELGQLVVLVALLPLLTLVRRSPVAARLVTRAVSAGVAACGFGWLVTRLDGLG